MGDDDYTMELVGKLYTGVYGAYGHEPDNMLTLAEVISVMYVCCRQWRGLREGD